METQDILRRYADHYIPIKRIGAYPLNVQLQLADLGVDYGKKNPSKVETELANKEMKAETQRCYNDMAKDNLKMPVLDYLCLISTLWLLKNCPVSVKTPKEYIAYLIKNYANHKEETNNLLRLFNKKPEYLFSLIKTNDVELYKELAGFWFNQYIS